MSDEGFSLHQLLTQDPRYPLDAYLFVREALSFASDSLELGNESLFQKPDSALPAAPPLELGEADIGPDPDEPAAGKSERHLTGQELCEAIRIFAIKQFGYMARVVFQNWGITATSDFGNIVYNMISVGLMKKSPNDHRAHFDDVYDFTEVFENQFDMKTTGS